MGHTYSVDVLSQIDSESESCDEDEVGKDLDDAVEPDEAGETEQPDADGTDGEEDYKCQGSHHTMCDHHCLGFLVIAPKGNIVAAETEGPI